MQLWWILLVKNNSEQTVKEEQVKINNVYESSESLLWSLQEKAWTALPQIYIAKLLLL